MKYHKSYLHKLLIVIATLSIISVVSGCKKDPTLTLSVMTSSFGDSGGQTSISIQSNTVWTVKVSEPWCTVSKLSGKGDAMVNVTIGANNSYSSRSVIITVTAETLVSSVTINQSQKDALIITSKTVNVPSAGATVEVELKSNISYDVILPADAPWVLHTGTKALNTYTHLITVAPNTGYDARSAKVIFKDKNSALADTLTINQLQKDAIFVNPKIVNLEDVGGTFNIVTSSNIQFDIIIPQTVTWLTHVESKGLVTGTHTFNVSANSTYDSRGSTIIFRQKGGTIADTVLVNQKPKTFIEIDKSFLYVQKVGGVKIVKVTSNADYQIVVEGGSGWVSQTAGQNTKTGQQSFQSAELPVNEHIFTISQNNSGAERTARIIVKYSNKADTAIVRQYIYPGYLVRPEAGESLDQMIPLSERAAIRDLKIEGNISENDFATIRGTLRSVESLDISAGVLSNNTLPQGAFKVTGTPGMSLLSIILPSNLAVIGAEAFFGCTALNDIILPNTLTTLGTAAFKGCTSLPGITLPASVTAIGAEAFFGCSSLLQVVSKIINPFPLSAVFSGIASGASLIVPVGRLSAYTSTTGWGYDFFSIIYEEGSAPVDVLSLSTSSLLSTGAGESFNLTLEASGSWSIDSKPTWVSITPSTGVGTRSITVTFNPYSTTPVTRSGSIVFRLNGKTLTANLGISQYNFPYKDGDYVKVQSSTLGNGIDLVFLGDGYTIEDIGQGKFMSNMNSAVSHFFSIEPYKTYRSYFNVYVIYAFSQESGISDATTTKNTKFSTKYNNPAPSTSMSTNNTLCFEYALKAPLSSSLSETLITVIANSTRYAGTAFLYSDGKAIAIAPVSDRPYPYDFRGVLQHEAAGHGFGKLADEYVTNSTTIPLTEQNSLRSWQSWSHFRNVDLTNNYSTILWKHFIGDPLYSYVGAYEGAYYYAYGVWRPESGSLMINNIAYINAPSRELIVKRIKQLAGEPYSFADFKARDVKETGVLTKSAGIPFDASMLLPPPVLIKVD